MSDTLVPFDIAALLDSDQAISEYLSQVLADGDTDELIRALGHVARARGMTQIAKTTGQGRAASTRLLPRGPSRASIPWSRSCARWACSCAPPYPEAEAGQGGRQCSRRLCR